MKQQMKNKLMQELPPVAWHKLDDNSLVMVSTANSIGERTTCSAKLRDLKRYFLNEILTALENKERPVKTSHIAD